MEITYWHRLVQLFHNKELELSEIAKVWIINTAIGVIEDNTDVLKLGINVLDNSQINSALVYGILTHYPEGRLISYTEFGAMLNLSAPTIGRAVKRLIEDGYIVKEDFGASGSRYTLVPFNNPEDAMNIPKWIVEFTKAIVELVNDESLREETMKQTEEIHFYRGMQVLQKELRDKFYRRKQPKK